MLEVWDYIAETFERFIFILLIYIIGNDSVATSRRYNFIQYFRIFPIMGWPDSVC